MSDGWAENPYRALSTAALLREREVLQWNLAEIDARPEGWQFVPESRALMVYTLRRINEVIERRRRLVGKPNAPAWPNESPDRELERARERSEIKERIRISDLIHRSTHKYGEFERRRGNDVWCCCPLPGHDEDTPSFHFDDQQGLFHCFGCKRGGDLFELARHLWDEPEFWRVAERLRDLAGIQRVERPAQPERPNVTRPNGQTQIVRIASPKRPAYGMRR